MGKLAFCDYHNMVAILEKTEHNTDFHQIVDFLEASHIRIETTDEETKIIAKGEGSKNPTEPHHTPSDKDEQIPQSPTHEHITQSTSHEQTTSQDPPQQETYIPSQSHTDIPTPRRLTKWTIRIAPSKVPSLGADEPASPPRDDSHGEAFPTATSLDAGQDKENIAKTSAMPYEPSPRVTSLGGGEGSMQQQLQELMELCTTLQQQHLVMEQKIQSQDIEITQLKTRVKTLEDNEQRRERFTQEDAPNTGGMNQGEALVEKSTKKGSEDTVEVAHVLSTMEAANVLSSRGAATNPVDITTIATVTSIAPAGVATVSGSFPTAAIFTTANVATPHTRRTRDSRGIIIKPF
ncbi:hypothetical protein Tco_0158858 [Tanacetum coccineum]